MVATTERFFAAYQVAEVRLFSAFGEGSPRQKALTALTGEPLPGGVSAMAGDDQRLVVGMGFTDEPAPNTGAVIVVEFVL